MTSIIKFIENQGAILSGELEKYLVVSEGIGQAAARKRVQRLDSPVHKLKGLFTDRQSLLYHSKKYNSEVYFQKIREGFREYGKRYFAIISAIEFHRGSIAKEELANYSFSPVQRIKGHLSYDTLINNLFKHNILTALEDGYQLNSYLYPDPNYRYYKAIQLSKKIVINQFMNWSRNIGLNSFDKGQQNFIVAGFQFAYTAPSYINGLVQYKKDGNKKPGFLIADVLVGDIATSQNVDFFIQKLNIIQRSNPTLKFLPILIVNAVDEDALNRLKSIGVIIASIKEIFGENYTKLLQDLINTITNAAAILKTNPDEYIKLMSSLSKLVDGKTLNLRGDLFEMAVGYYYSRFCLRLEIGQMISGTNDLTPREIDVLAEFETEVKVVECKGYHSPIGKEFIEIYLGEKVPVIRNWLVKTYPRKNHIFEIWSTGGFTKEAAEILNKAKSEYKKYQIDFLNEADIIEKANQLQSNRFKTILRQYYFNEMV